MPGRVGSWSLPGGAHESDESIVRYIAVDPAMAPRLLRDDLAMAFIPDLLTLAGDLRSRKAG